MLKFVIPRVIGSLGKSGVNVGDYSVYEVRQLQRALKNIEPTLRTQLVRDVKAIGKPLQMDIKSAIGQVTPLSGMIGNSRISWGGTRPADSTAIQFRTQAGGKSLTTSLLRVKVNSPATVLADMAGRSKRYVGSGYRGSGYTREFERNGVSMRRRTTREAGLKFIENLDSKLGKSASRFVWPSAEGALPAIRQAVDRRLKEAFDLINRKGI
jgi:hypothetical protein